MSASRSLHRRSPPSPPMISSRPTIRSRMRSPPERRRPIDSGSPRSRRPTDLRFPPARRSRSPVGKPRSLSPPIKRNMSPKIIPEVSRRVPPGPVRKSRSRSPMGLSRLPEYKISGSSVPGSSEKFRGNSIERDRILFRGPEGSINYDIKELKKIAVEIRRTPGRGPETVQISRAVTNVEDIVSARRTGDGKRNLGASFGERISKPDWPADNFRHPKDFQSESSRPIHVRPEFLPGPSTSRDRMSDDYRRIIAIDPVLERERSEREKSRVRSGIRYSPGPYEERVRSFYPNEGRERPRSPDFSVSRRSPPREYFDSREKIREERQPTVRDDLRHELEMRKRDDGRYSERPRSMERDRMIEKRVDSHFRHEDRPYEREKRRIEHYPGSPPRERRRGSIDLVRPTRGELWDREFERDMGGDRRKRPHSPEDSRMMRGSMMRERMHPENFDDIPDRARRSPFKPENRSYFKDDNFGSSLRSRGSSSSSIFVRRGHPGSLSRGRPPMRGSSRGFRGGPPRGSGGFSRGGPPRGGSRGYNPRK